MSRPVGSAMVIGGGFYGCCLALYLNAAGHEVVILEQGQHLLGRASLVNQARIHYGYHYPRSFVTAVRSAINFPRFTVDFRHAVLDGFDKVYAIARNGSKVSASQFHAFCTKVGAPIAEAPHHHSQLFERDLVEAVFSVKELAFDAVKLRDILGRRLHEAGVTVHLGIQAQRLSPCAGGIDVVLADGTIRHADQVFVATYSRINTLLGASELPQLPLKHEITEIALVRHPLPLANMGVTVMDGAFFSTMPFPSRDAHSFTHVRYTPHGSWSDLDAPADPDLVLAERRRQSTYPLMVKDAARFLPTVSKATYLESLFEVKTVLLQNEGNDGRPILFRRDYAGIPGLSVVMGGKIDNIYDIFAAIGTLRDEACEGAEDGWMSRILQGIFHR